MEILRLVDRVQLPSTADCVVSAGMLGHTKNI